MANQPAGRALRSALVLAAFVVVVQLAFKMSLNNWVAGISLGSLYGVVAVGLILIYRTNKIINFAAGALGAVPAIFASLLVVFHHQNYLLMLPIVIVGGALAGFVVDLVVIRRFSRSPRLILTVVTIAVAQTLAVPGFFLPVWLGFSASAIPVVTTPWQSLKWNDSVGRPILTGNEVFALVVVIALAAGLALFLRYTRVGIALRASAENTDRASLLGIPVKLVGTVAWMLAGLISGLAIFAQAPLIGVPSNATLGFDTLLYALAAAVIAGMERMGVAVVAGMGVGVIIFGSISTSGDNNLATALMLVVILGALLLQRGTASRAYASGVSSWQAVREYRRIPSELIGRWEVQAARAVTPLACLAALVAVAFVFPPEQLPNLILLPLFGTAAVSLVVLTGWAGQISLGQFGLIGISAAVAGGLVANHNIDFFAALGVGVGVGVVAAIVVGLPAIRIQGLYLAVSTLAFGYAIHDYVLNVHYPIGKAIMPAGIRPHLFRPVVFGVLDLEDNRSFYLACVAVLVLCMAGAYAFRKYRSGRVLLAARDNPAGAAAYGISATGSRLAAFAASGAMAGLCGVMFAYSQHQVVRDSYTVQFSIAIFLAAAIGGLNSVGFAVVGAMAFEAISLFGPNLFSGSGATGSYIVPLLVVGPLPILNLYLNPRGLAEGGYWLRDAFLRHVAKRHDILVPSLIADGRSDRPRPSAPVPRRGLFWRLGYYCARRAWFVLGAWLVFLVAVTFGSSALNGVYNAALNLPNSSAQIGADIVKAHTYQAGTSTPGVARGDVVFHATRGSLADYKGSIQAAVSSIGLLSTVKAVSDPMDQLSPDGHVAIASITYQDSVTQLDQTDAAAVNQATAPLRSVGIYVDYTGDLGQAAGPSSSNTGAELIGVGVALVIVLLAFGSVLATLLPVGSAVVGVFAGVGVLGILSAFFQFPSEAPTLALMMGLGVGIDYALFLSTRFRQHIIDGEDPLTAVARAISSSGRAVVIAATTVVVALIGLYASGVFFIGQLGVSAGITVAVAALAAVTLVPALLGLAGRRIDVLKVRRSPVAESTANARGWQRYATALSRRPALYLAAALGLLVLLALPVLSIQIGDPGVRSLPYQNTERRASDFVDAAFGPGYQAQLTVVVKVPANQLDTQIQSTALSLQRVLASTSGVESAGVFVPTQDRAALVGKVIPTTGLSDNRTADLINRLQDKVLPGQLSAQGYSGYVTGGVAKLLAVHTAVQSSLPVIILSVVAAAMLLILITFRSPVLAVKAGLINLLSIGASYGVLVAVFQWAWGSSLLGIPQPIPIVSYVPVLMFAIIFGLSMDYEIFLLARIKEAWDGGATNRGSVTHGLAVTARIITSAAVIMACVFFSFVLVPTTTIKMLALGLGVSVIIDVTVVRLVIVPTAMFLFGRGNWWTPAWLDRLLPHFETEDGAPRSRPDVEETERRAALGSIAVQRPPAAVKVGRP